MIKKQQIEGQDDPYEVIRRLREALEEQKGELEEYQMVCNVLAGEKEAAMRQSHELRGRVDQLTQRMEQNINKSRTITSGALTATQSKSFSKQNKQYLTTLSPQIIKSNNLVSSNIIPISSPNEGSARRQSKSREFVPEEIIFKKRQVKTEGLGLGSGQSSSEHLLQNVGENMIEDLMVICPDSFELKKLREARKEQRAFTVKQCYFFNFNPLYKNRKAEYLKEVARRAFPTGALARRKTVTSYQQLKEELDFPVSGRMGEEYFIFNLKGDFVDNQKGKTFLGDCNPYQALFAVCLRVPDFIPIREEKTQQRKQQEVWMVDKVYVILTYLPFFHIHLSLLAKIHQIIQPPWHKLHCQQILARNLQRNLAEAQHNPQVNKFVTYFLNRRPDYDLSCILQPHYFGNIPSRGFNCQHTIARFACPLFFSVFAYEEMLLLLTAMFMEKTVVFVSKSESASTLCALFLTTIIAPFRYNQHLIINCDKEKVDNIVFQFPFILVATIKKEDNFGNILRMFIDSNCDRFKGFSGKDKTGPLVLVDIDSNSIFYDPLLNRTFEEVIVDHQYLRQAYREVNSAQSKSFTFPKKMPVEFMARPKNDYQKNQQERRKLLKEYHQKVDNNTSKWPTYTPTAAHHHLLKLVTEYIHSFGISPDYQTELIKTAGSNHQIRKQNAKRDVMMRHPCEQKLVSLLAESQLFADYLDQLERKVSKS